VGSTAALGALFLYAFDPNIIAHSALVTTDVGVTAFEVLFLFALWRYMQRLGWRRLVLCGLALGAVLGAKFSAVFLLPVAAVLLAAEIRWPIASDVEPAASAEKRNPEKRIPKAAPNSPCPCGSGKKYKRCHGAGAAPGKDVARTLRQHQLIKTAGMFLAMCAIAALVIETLYFFPSDPLLYLTGLNRVNADHVAGYRAYLHGALAPRFYTYFAVTYLLKEPLATVLLCVAGLVILVRRKSIPVLVKLLLLLTPAVFFVPISLLADDIGIRYLIPTLPFAYLLGGLALAELFDKGPAWGRYVGAALCLWLVVEAAGIYPDHLSYFNESACLLESPGKIGWDGGSRCGGQWLDDSNIDWGQGIKQLHAWLDLHAKGRQVRLTYFGSYPPEGYGLNYRKQEPSRLLANPEPGLYAVSAHWMARLPALAASSAQGTDAWLRRPPQAIVGHAFYIFDVP